MSLSGTLNAKWIVIGLENYLACSGTKSDEWLNERSTIYDTRTCQTSIRVLSTTLIVPWSQKTCRCWVDEQEFKVKAICHICTKRYSQVMYIWQHNENHLILIHFMCIVSATYHIFVFLHHHVVILCIVIHWSIRTYAGTEKHERSECRVGDRQKRRMPSIHFLSPLTQLSESESGVRPGWVASLLQGRHTERQTTVYTHIHI